VVWLASGAPSLVGPVTWRKPIEFGISGAITTLSLAWVMGRLPRSPGWDWSAAILIAFFVPETLLIDMQQWRGVPSHFNYDSGFDAAVFSVMGILIGVVAIGIAILAVRAFGRVSGPPSTAVAIRAGMIFLLIGQLMGGLILANAFGPGSTVANASIVGAAGELKVPHALGLHGLQVLAVLALILERAQVSARSAVTGVASCALGYGLLIVAATLQTYAGLGPLALTPLTGIAALVGVVLIAGPYLRGLSAALRRPSLA
jgi:hypothetical protein